MNVVARQDHGMLAGMSPLTSAISQHVLVVEDEGDLRRLMTLVLQRAGFVVTGVGSLAEAAGALIGSRFDHAVIDLCLPDGRGDQLVPRLRESSPETRIILTSAFAHASATIQLAAGAGDAFIAKPFSNRELVALLRAAPATG